MTFGQIVRQTFTLMADDAIAVLTAIIGLAGISTIFDIAAPSAGNLLGIPILVVQWAMLRRLVDRLGLRSADRSAGFGSFFLLGIITGIPTILGALLLIVPGIYLAARWSMSSAALIAENEGASNAASRSWAATSGHAIPLMLATTLFFLPSALALAATFGLGIGVGAANHGLDASTIYGVDAALNLFTTLSQVMGWYYGVAVYLLLVGRPDAALAEVFA